MLTHVPKGLGARGQAFYDHAVATFELDQAETELLTQACRLLDRADELRAVVATDGLMLTTSQGNVKAHPALSEERQVSLTLGRLLAQLQLPADDGSMLESPLTAKARRAAESRWRDHRAHKAAQEAWRDGQA